MSFKSKIFHFICVKHYQERSLEKRFQLGLDKSREFFNRFNNSIDFSEKSIIDIGCGLGATCIYMALHGAKRVVGIDLEINHIDFAKKKLETDYNYLINTVEFKHNNEMKNELFDIIISKDCFEHYENPETFIFTMKKYMKKDGIMVIGFSPLWKSPYGGHINDLTRFPWAHLIFPEKIIIDEYSKLRNENMKYFRQGIHGFNKMTLKRYQKIINESGLKPEFFIINVASTLLNKIVFSIFNIFKHFPFLKDYFIVNIYSILRQV